MSKSRSLAFRRIVLKVLQQKLNLTMAKRWCFGYGKIAFILCVLVYVSKNSALKVLWFLLSIVNIK